MIRQRDLIIVSYPFSDLTTRKVRPAVVISNNNYNKIYRDVVVVPLTTKPAKEFSIKISQQDLESGRLLRNSTIRIDKILSIEKKIIRKVVGKIKPDIHKNIVRELNQLIS